MASQREIFVHRLKQRIAERGTNNRAVSVAVTGKPDLVRDALRRESIPNGAIVHRLAEELGTTSDWLLGLSETPEQVKSEISFRDPPQPWNGPARDGIPVLGTGYCEDLVLSDGDDTVEIERAMLETDHTVRMIARPSALWNAPDAYAIQYIGGSMEPRFYQGELGIVDPRRHPGPGDFVVVQLNDGESDDVVTVLVKQLVRIAGGFYELRQFNPDRTFRIERRRVARLHRILSGAEVYT